MHITSQMALFSDRNLNIVYEIKRQIRLALSSSRLSRDEVADEMNRLASRDNVNTRTMNRETLDGWCKDSELSRIPSLPSLVLFCAVLNTVGPIRAMLQALGADAISGDDAALLSWARAERERRRATKRARIAMESLDL